MGPPPTSGNRTHTSRERLGHWAADRAWEPNCQFVSQRRSGKCRAVSQLVFFQISQQELLFVKLLLRDNSNIESEECHTFIGRHFKGMDFSFKRCL